MLSQKPLRQSDYRLETIDNELLLFHPAKTQVMYFNQSASIIWQLCDGQRTPPEIISLLCEAYPESAVEISRDVEETLRLFLEYGAIEFA